MLRIEHVIHFVYSSLISELSPTVTLATRIKSTSSRMPLACRDLTLITTEALRSVLCIMKYAYTSMKPEVYELNVYKKDNWIKKTKKHFWDICIQKIDKGL